MPLVKPCFEIIKSGEKGGEHGNIGVSLQYGNLSTISLKTQL